MFGFEASDLVDWKRGVSFFGEEYRGVVSRSAHLYRVLRRSLGVAKTRARGALFNHAFGSRTGGAR